MKEYVKPSIKVVHLDTEETLLAASSGLDKNDSFFDGSEQMSKPSGSWWDESDSPSESDIWNKPATWE